MWPIKGGEIYGANQRVGIQKDIDALIQGKKKSKIEPEEYWKFMVFLDLPEIRAATKHFVSNMKKNKESILFMDDNTPLGRVKNRL